METLVGQLDDLSEVSRVRSKLSELNQYVNDVLRGIEEDPEVYLSLRDSTKEELLELRRYFEASLDAAYQNPNVDTWELAERKKSFLWLLSVSLVESEEIDEDGYNKRWLRYLLSEKIPKQVSNMDVRLFLRTCDYRYLPRQYFSDRDIRVLLGSYKKRIEEQKLIVLKYFQNPKPVARKRGYTDGKGCQDFSTDPSLLYRETRKDELTRDYHDALQELQDTIEQAEEFLSTLGVPGRRF
jgi:hypothetical protein